ncbi:MAG: hypothetical protein Q8O30_01465 [Candidatus Omnitrophota bacterium]|nr:hypothetical protein [Candidatus Omnitrophota bacterium]
MDKKKTLYLSALIIFFILGWFLNSVIETISIHQEKPLLGDKEISSPYNRIKEDDLQLSPDKLVINLPGIALASYTDTNSMDPLLDERTTGIEIIPKTEEEIHVGDIVAYESGNDLIPHRVIQTGKDEQGWYAIVKGDNSENLEKIRFEQIRYVLIGVFY